MGEEKLDLKEFLERLAEAQDLLYRFARDPQATMESFQLPDSDIELLKEGDLSKIRARVKELGGDVVFGLPVHIWPVHIPLPVHWPWPWPWNR